jgi:hypothetical protein
MLNIHPDFVAGVREYSKGDLSAFDSLECGEIGKCSKHFEL